MINEMGGDFLQWIRGFYFVAQRASLKLASFDMGRSQPTLSHQIKSLEKAFGVMLFDRSRGKMELTPEGKALLMKTISIFEIIKEMQNEIDENHMQANGIIKIASTHAIIHCYLPKHIVRFRAQSPNVAFELKGGGQETILESVESAEVDFGIASLDSHSGGIVYHDLFETGLELISPKKNPFFKTKKPTLKQISDVPFIAQPASSTRTSLIQTKFSDMDLNLNVVLILNNFESIKEYVELGAGVSILDDFTLTKNDRERINTYSLDRYFGRKNYGIIIRKNKYLSPPVKAFIHMLRPDIQI